MTATAKPSPLQQALQSTLTFAVVALVIRLVWGAVDPEMRNWSLLAVAPLSGLHTFLYASGRLRAIATLLIAFGIGGLVLWTTVLVGNWWPTTRQDVPYVVLVFAFPVVALGLGLAQLRKLRQEPQSPSA